MCAEEQEREREREVGRGSESAGGVESVWNKSLLISLPLH